MLEAGATVDGLTVRRVTGVARGRWAVAEAASAHDRPVTLYTTGPGPAPRRLLAALEQLRAEPDAPLDVPAAGEADGLLYVAAAPPPGTTLADRLREGPLPPEEAVRLLSQVAGALETLALNGVPAGPLRPDRIILTARRPQQARLWDIGIADEATPACARADLLDQVAYLAPEAARGAPADAAVAVYALGCILFECLTGAPPFRAARPLLVLDAHATAPPPKVSDRARVPVALDRVMATALSKFPAQRQRDPGALMRATQRALRVRMPIPVLKPQDAAAPATPPEAAPAPAPTPARAAKPARERRRPRRERAKQCPERGRRRWRVPASVTVAATMIVASTAGFATAQLETPTKKATPSAKTAGASPRTADDRATAAQEAAYVTHVDRAIHRLGTRRAAARHRLRQAQRARDQAAASLALARVYADAARLPPLPRGTSLDARLAPDLASTADAYRGLATAARRGDPAAFRAARRNVVANEAAIARDLKALSERSA
jgi:serine/threonine-protein kinase